MKEQKKELELYIHIPFCVKKCDYCDFLSFAADETTQTKYVRALQKELEFYGKKYGKTREITTIFFGGGTPSWLHEDAIAKLMEQIKSDFSVKENAEITIECNPGTVTWQKLEVYKKAGINRLSIGLQSAHDAELKMLGRIHTYGQFLNLYGMAAECGFSNMNVDLISSLPGQTAEIFCDSLRQVLKLRPKHLSVYSLIIEPGTPFYEKYEADAKRQAAGMMTQSLPTEEEEYKTTKLTRKMLKDAGYHWYEVSNFAKEGYECRHNIGYWKRVDYLGVGLGASSLMENVRYSNTTDLFAYGKLWECGEKMDKLASLGRGCSCEGLEKTKRAGSLSDNEIFDLRQNVELLSKKEQMEEFLFLGLRMCEGISREEFEKMFHTSIEAVYGTVLDKLQHEELLEKKQGRIFLTEKGMDVNNYVVAQFML